MPRWMRPKSETLLTNGQSTRCSLFFAGGDGELSGETNEVVRQRQSDFFTLVQSGINSGRMVEASAARFAAACNAAGSELVTGVVMRTIAPSDRRLLTLSTTV